ncbi:MAG: lipocalin family protein [Methylococcales bacterium]|nr:lipocalin family protein [Methylococcales bacterium]
MLLRTLLIALTMTVSVSALADVKLTEADILGEWKIDAESINADGSDAKELSSIWTFRNDGTMEGVSVDTNKHARISEFRAVIKYSIEDGKLNKQNSPGRSKFDLCTATEKNGPKMTLECNHIYFFMTKK